MEFAAWWTSNYAGSTTFDVFAINGMKTLSLPWPIEAALLGPLTTSQQFGGSMIWASNLNGCMVVFLDTLVFSLKFVGASGGSS